MEKTTANRAQSNVIGVLLIFGFLIIALSGYQAVAVPQQNQVVEYQHNQVVQGDMHDLRNALLNAREAESAVSTSIRLGTQYPLRVATINPPPPTGRLATVDPETNIKIDNARVQGEVAGDTSVLFEEHETKFLTYEPQYHEYQNAPETTYEHSLLYNQFDNTEIAVTNQRLVQDNEVTLTLVSGQLSRSSAETISIDPRVVDGPTTRLPITSNGDEPITIQLPTRSPEMWKKAIGESFDDGEKTARVTAAQPNQVTIELKSSEEPYYLRMSRVSIGADSNTDGGQFDIGEADSSSGDGGGETTYSVQWLTEATDGVSYDSETRILEIDRGVTGNTVNLDTQVTASGTPVSGTEVAFATTDEQIIGFNQATDATGDDGRAQANLDIGQVGDVRIFAAAGDSVAPLSVRVVDSTGGSDGGSDNGFTRVTASGLSPNTNSQVQTLTFTLDADLPEGETVEIDLSDATGDVEYPNGNGQYNVQRGSGSVRKQASGVITYTAGRDDNAGESIRIQVQKVDTQGTYSGEYTAVFSRSDGDATETTFGVRTAGSRSINNPTTGDVSVTGSVNVNRPLDGSVDAGGSVNINSNGQVSGDVIAGGAVAVNSEVSGSVDAGGDVDVNSNGRVGGDVSAGGSVNVNNRVEGSVAAGRKVTVNSNGFVGGTVRSESSVTLNYGATVQGDVFVSRSRDLTCNGGTINGQSCADYKNENY